jgi:hypothetical protein
MGCSVRDLAAHPRVDELHPLAPRELGIRRLLAAGLARLRWRALDHALADGADAASSTALAARARHLTRHETRARIAESVRTVILEAGRPPSMPSSRIPPSRPEVPAARLELAAIESRLRSEASVDARGIARLELLLTDGGGPLYSPDYPAALSAELDRIMAALGAREEDLRDARAQTR